MCAKSVWFVFAFYFSHGSLSLYALVSPFLPIYLSLSFSFSYFPLSSPLSPKNVISLEYPSRRSLSADKRVGRNGSTEMRSNCSIVHEINHHTIHKVHHKIKCLRLKMSWSKKRGGIKFSHKHRTFIVVISFDLMRAKFQSQLSYYYAIPPQFCPPISTKTKPIVPYHYCTLDLCVSCHKKQ